MEDLKAKTSDGVPFYNKIDYNFLRRVAEAITAGSIRYDPHLMVENWRLGDVQFYHDRANHAQEHLLRWLAGDRTEDHLAHTACNLMMLMFGEEQGIYNPATPEVRLLQWVAFVKASQEQKAEVTSPPVVKEETLTEEAKEVELGELLPDEQVIDHVSVTGKPVINVAKATEILLG